MKAKLKLHLATLNIYSPSDIHEICQMSINAIQVVKQNYLTPNIIFSFQTGRFLMLCHKKDFQLHKCQLPKIPNSNRFVYNTPAVPPTKHASGSKPP